MWVITATDRNRLRSALLVLSLAMPVGCHRKTADADREPARPDATLPQPYGFAVLTNRAGDYGFTPGDTLLEIQRDQIPAQLRDNGGEGSRPGSDACTRVFGHSPYLILVATACDPAEYRTDNVAAFVARVSGDSVSDVRPASGLVTMVCPQMRDRSSAGYSPQASGGKIVGVPESCGGPLQRSSP